MGIFSKDNEQQIIKLFSRGDASAMDRLYAEYSGYLTAVSARYIANDDDIKDVLQEAFIRIFTTIDAFEYRGNGSLRAWMTRIVVNECLMYLRRKRKSPFVDYDAEQPDIPDETPDTQGISAETMTQLIRQLPEGYRAVLNLYVIEGRSHKEISEMLGIKPDSSASQLHRAKNMLARIINEYKHRQ